MKQAVFSLPILLFFLLFTKVNIYAQTATSPTQAVVVTTDTPIGTMSANPSTPSSTVNYELPYPGILPDNPLYIFKVIRDAIVKFLIKDPLKKAQFSLLTAEKRMYAGEMLMDKGNQKLAIVTIEKSNNYLNDALNEAKTAKKKTPKDPGIMSFLSQMRTATLKNEEIMVRLTKSANTTYSQRFNNEKNEIKGITSGIDKLLPSN